MKVAILYICTGRYNQFFKGFYESCERNFLPNSNKEYFVWTDDDDLAEGRGNVYIYHKECAGFPADSLFRFEMFLQAEKELKEFDYIYFLNSNAAIIKPVGNEILPDESGLAMGRWPGKRMTQHPMFYPYERNKNSLAYIAPGGKNYIYFMGGFNGGTSDAYLTMIRVLSNNIREDYTKGIIACVHDESHINKYLRSHPCKVLGPLYTTPEEYTYKHLDYEPYIIFRDKVKVDPYFNKGRNRSQWGQFCKGVRILKRALKWYL
ncbi:hypothetical protein C799_01616 [Bacteroides thetaiotaomicron dnLKV9]|uniref:Glycosyltransferase family 6 n=1 Tax=Bacteroides thetaiotaomicron dnLKV9 TaxID=1235785 RepID=R9HB19_BACT4|nr:family 6 glucosyltransferase [Bacteroides thetaiotaomicron]EOS01238.1 hypothetical protein C799_01616 [Bacteroides thetaiotaomicron dnLKV9]